MLKTWLQEEDEAREGLLIIEFEALDSIWLHNTQIPSLFRQNTFLLLICFISRTETKQNFNMSKNRYKFFVKSSNSQVAHSFHIVPETRSVLSPPILGLGYHLCKVS